MGWECLMSIGRRRGGKEGGVGVFDVFGRRRGGKEGGVGVFDVFLDYIHILTGL